MGVGRVVVKRHQRAERRSTRMGRTSRLIEEGVRWSGRF